MKLQSLYLKNFNCFPEKVIKLNPFTVISGENGTGKTTILQAIEFLLTGSIVNPTTGKNLDLLGFFYPQTEEFEVKGYFKIGSNEYQITRKAYRKEKNGKQSVSTEILVSPKPLLPFPQLEPTNTELNRWFNSLIGNVIQIDFRNFFELSPEKRFDFLSKYLKIQESEYSDVKDLLKKEFSDLPINYQMKGLTFLNQAISEIHDYILYLKRQKDEKKKTSKGIELAGLSLEKVDIDLNNLLKEKEEIQEKIAQNQGKKISFDTIQQSLENFQERKRIIENKIKELEKQIKDNKESLPSYNIDYCLKEIAKYEKEEKLIAENLEEMKEDSKKLEEEYNLLVGEKNALSKQINEIKRFVKQKNKICPLCATRITIKKEKEIEEYLNKQEKELMNINIKARECEIRIKEHNKKIDEIIIYRTKIREALIKNKNEERMINNINNRNDLIRSQIEELKNESKENEVKIKKLQLAYSEIKPVDEILVSLFKKQRELEDKIQIANRERGVLITKNEILKSLIDLNDKIEKAEDFENTLLKLKEAEVTNGIKPLIKKASDIFNALDEESPYIFEIRFQDERKNTVLQPGMKMRMGTFVDSFIPFEKINQGHQIKILLSLLFAIDKKGFRIFLLDNMEKVSKYYMERFYQTLKENEGLWYDNIILASTQGWKADIDLKL